MNQKAGAATVKADYNQTQLQSQTDKSLYDLGVISGLAYKASKGKADELTIRNGLEDQRLDEHAKVDRRATRRTAGEGRSDAGAGGAETEAAGCS